MNTSGVEKVQVAVVGGGPAGLVVAIELGRRGVPVVVFERESEPPSFPKANATTSRTMEHFRRLGFADKIRAVALPPECPSDVAYFTRYSTHELARLRGQTLAPGDWRSAHLARWPTAEPLARVQQMYVEAELRRQIDALPSITMLSGWSVTSLDTSSDFCLVRAVHEKSGEICSIEASYVVGADGARSVVRQHLGIRYEGMQDTDRAFMGGRMLATYFRSPSLYKALEGRRAWQYWALNPAQRGLLCTIDTHGLFVHHTAIKNDDVPDATVATRNLFTAAGLEFEIELLGYREWTAGFVLVAERMSNAQEAPRVFLLGDAAHLFTPTGGQGYNTAVDDAVNLGWKLGAVHGGWGGPKLLAAYEQERRPIAKRNTAFAQAMAESIGRLAVPADIEDSAAKQAVLAEWLANRARTEFDIPGITYGVYYGGSPVVIGDGSAAPADAWNEYTPTTIPGARAPHIWLEEGRSIQDGFGPDFTLLCFREPPDSARVDIEAFGRKIPLKVLVVRHDEAARLYAKAFVLVRPDSHVAWRGDRLPADFGDIVRRCVGW